MSVRRIVGISLVRNEDRFLGRALENAAAFCDEFLLFDNGSTDGSPTILRDFVSRHARASVSTIRNPGDSHRALEPLAGQPVWVFGVDGDEIYDPGGLAALRKQLLAGEFDDWWMVLGHCLHVETLSGGYAHGFLAPPSRSITKLYNFAAVEAWPGPTKERLHGGRPVFRHGYGADKKRLLYEETRWEDSHLRCLHMCFLPRSLGEDPAAGPRRNIDEIYNSGSWLRRLTQRLSGGGGVSDWKRERYRRGEPRRVDTEAFF